MLRTKKNKSILLMLLDRESNNARDPYFQSVNAVSALLHSEAPLYKHRWKKSSKRPISYDSGYLYFNDYTCCYTINGRNSQPSSLFKLQKSQASKKISDVISYSIPVFKAPQNTCTCQHRPCICLSQYLLSVSEDNWLCKHSMTTGKLLKEFYVNRFDHKFMFKYCDWDIYAARFVLTSILNPDRRRDGNTSRKTDVVANIAVLTVCPLEFFTLFEVKRSVFGESCSAANLSDQHMVIGLGCANVNIYSFVDFINLGNLTPFKLGDIYEDIGKIGQYPVGLPLNFTYTEAPPVLFNVQCFGQLIRFGGYPYHCITADVKNSNVFTVARLGGDSPSNILTLESDNFNDDVDSLMFHPDHSNRLLFKDSNVVHCLRLDYLHGSTEIKNLFSMGFSEPTKHEIVVTSSGRTIKSNVRNNSGFEFSIYCTDYASDLDLIAIMGAQAGDANAPAFVKLYNSYNGKLVRNLELKEEVNDIHFYQLFLDMGSIIIIEKKDRLIFTVYVYNM